MTVNVPVSRLVPLAGALFAVHQDKALAAFDLAQVARALRLPADCAR